MTAPEKKSKAKSKPKTPSVESKAKTAANKAAVKKEAPSIKEAENALKSEANEPVKKKGEKAKAPKFLSQKPEEFKVGTKEYGKVVAEFNKCFGRQYNLNRVPPYIFKTMFDRLRKVYNVNE